MDAQSVKMTPYLTVKLCKRLNEKYTGSCKFSVRDITKLHGYPRSNVKTRLEQSNLFLASGRFPLRMLSKITNCRFHGCDTVNRRNIFIQRE